MKNLKKYKVAEISFSSSKSISGGNPILWTLSAMAGGFLYNVAADWDENVQAFNEAYNNGRN